VKVEIWPDIIRPWCGLGDHRLDRALQRFEHGPDVEGLYGSVGCAVPGTHHAHA